MARRPIELVRGELHVPQSVLFLDARRRRECTFVSHAHGDHIGRHDRTIATAPTLALIRHRLGSRAQGEALPIRYYEPFGLGDLTIELFPAGHVLGSAQIRIVRRDVAVCYTGDLCLEPNLTAEAAEVVRCDVLVLESTFGKPRYTFPPKDQVLAQIRAFVDQALLDGCTPVLLGYALGKAQEALKYFGELGYPCRAHPLVHAIDQIYEAHGLSLPNVRQLGPEGPEKGELVVAPPHLSRSPLLSRIPRKRTAVLTGWAIGGSNFGWRGVDTAFPLSDHADFPSLLRYARESRASRIFTVHGYAQELATALRAEGIRAEPLEEERQLELL
jgi:putative mRNA 3-end processing factor